MILRRDAMALCLSHCAATADGANAIRMRRRDFIRVLGAAGLHPLSSSAQAVEQIRRIGLLSGLRDDDPEAQVIARALQEGLRDFGWVEGRNIRTEHRWAVDSPERARAAVEELLALPVDVIMPGTTQMAEAVRRANSPVPAIFVNVSDPVGTGLVQSLARPGGNITGFTNLEYATGEKWIQALKEIAPGVATIVVIANPRNPNTGLYLRALEPAAASLGMRLVVRTVRDGAEIEQAIEEFAHDRGAGLLAMPDPLTLANRDRILSSAARHRLPAAYPFRLFVERGGLLSYGTDRADLYRRAATYVDRLLKGEKAGDLPVQQPSRFELVINAKTAASLGLTVPPSLLARADEVIE